MFQPRKGALNTLSLLTHFNGRRIVMSQRTYGARLSDIRRSWHIIDVADKVLGRAASQIATLLKGKHKPMYTPSMDVGDHVIVINAAKVKVTGTKSVKKLY